MKDGQIEELAREIEMYYGVKRHLEELTKENQVKKIENQVMLNITEYHLK